MDRVLVWDLPTRVFHWLLAAGFITAAVIALAVGEHSRLFPYHGIIGLVLALLVLLRVLWGFVGTRYARLRSLLFRPGEVSTYLRGVFTGRGGSYVGHNPGSAYAILGMLVLMLALVATGVLLGVGFEDVGEAHEWLAYAMIGLATLHVLGVGLHTIRHRENITLAMISGRKKVGADAGIPSSRPGVLLAFLAIVGVWTLGLVRNFEPARRSVRLPLTQTILNFGEAEDEHHSDDAD